MRSVGRRPSKKGKRKDDDKKEGLRGSVLWIIRGCLPWCPNPNWSWTILNSSHICLYSIPIHTNMYDNNNNSNLSSKECLEKGN